MTTHLLETQQIWIDKSDLSQTKAVDKVVDLNTLEDGEVLLKIDTFGFSANNVTYALLGDKFGYWGFFPADKGFGIVPMWGFATVAYSNCTGVEVGERLFGYLPMASHWIVRPSKVSPQGFYDAHPARKSISPVYDNYLRCDQDPGYDANNEAVQMNIRPLFMTSFVLDDYVGENLDTTVKNIILTSASSKTAYGTAHLLHKHKAQRGDNYQVIGLTSAANLSFTEQLGCYDKVFTYDELEQLAANETSYLLDFAGNKQLLLNIQQQMTTKLAKVIFIGVTDVEAQRRKPQGAVDGEVFFAPAQVKKRSQEWGQQGFAQQYAKAWQSFIGLVENTVEVEQYRGAGALQKVYKQGLAGHLSNAKINVLRF